MNSGRLLRKVCTATLTDDCVFCLSLSSRCSLHSPRVSSIFFPFGLRHFFILASVFVSQTVVKRKKILHLPGFSIGMLTLIKAALRRTRRSVAAVASLTWLKARLCIRVAQGNSARGGGGCRWIFWRGNAQVGQSRYPVCFSVCSIRALGPTIHRGRFDCYHDHSRGRSRDGGALSFVPLSRTCM